MRLFIGVQLNEKANKELDKAISALKGISRGNYTRPDNLHMTLQFLGETDAGAIGTIHQAMEEAARGKTPMTFTLSHPGRFVRGGESIVWYGVRGQTALLGSLQKELCAALSANGVGFDKSEFKPHITLGRRVRFDMPWEEALQRLAVSEEPFEVDGIILFESARINGALTYTPIHIQRF